MRQKPNHTKPARFSSDDSPKANTPKPTLAPTTSTSILQELNCQADQYQSLGATSHAFPGSRCVLSHLLNHFGPGRGAESWQTMYCAWVKRLGGPKKVEDLLFGFVDEDIKALQGQLITAQRLQEVKHGQPVLIDRH